MRAVIIDDEELSSETLDLLLQRHCPEVEVCGIANSIDTGAALIERESPELVFLDIEMPFGTGFDVLDRISDIRFEIVITTAHNQYALRAIKVHAIDYLLKPIAVEDLKAAVHEAERRLREHPDVAMQNIFSNVVRMQNQGERIGLPTADGMLFVKIQDVIRCEADGNYTRVFLADSQELLISRPLKAYDKLLSKHNFFRIHHSHLINLNHVVRYIRGEGGHVITSDNSSVIVARSKKEALLKRLTQNGM